MFKAIKRFFCGPTPEEAYQNGRNCVDTMLAEGAAQGRDKALVAEHIYAMGSGGFNETSAHRAFDRGVNERLDELGYQCPY